MITLTLYGKKGNAPDKVVQKSDELGILLERGSVDRLFLDIDDIEPFRMIRLQNNGKGSRPDWYCDKVCKEALKYVYIFFMQNLKTVFVYHSKNKGFHTNFST